MYALQNYKQPCCYKLFLKPYLLSRQCFSVLKGLWVPAKLTGSVRSVCYIYYSGTHDGAGLAPSDIVCDCGEVGRQPHGHVHSLLLATES